MKMCPDCGTANREGVLFCEDCACAMTNAKPVANKASVKPMATPKPAPINLDLKEFMSRATVKLEQNRAQQANIVIYVRGSRKPIIVAPGQRVLLGRNAPDTPQKPDIDLTPFRGVECGVSRNHAIIDNSSGVPTIIDMGSANGVHINGTRLTAGKTQKLSHGDHLYLGRLQTYVQFKQVKRRTTGAVQ